MVKEDKEKRVIFPREWFGSSAGLLTLVSQRIMKNHRFELGGKDEFLVAIVTNVQKLK